MRRITVISLVLLFACTIGLAGCGEGDDAGSTSPKDKQARVEEPAGEQGGAEPGSTPLAEQPDASARVAQHLLVSEPAGDGWAVERLVEAACTAGKQGCPESEAVFLRRALAEPPPPADDARRVLLAYTL